MVKKFCCNICYKELSIFSIKNHLKLHDLKKLYLNCYFCQKKISSNSIFKHFKKHMQENQKREQKKENDEINYNKDNIKQAMKNIEEKFTICGKEIYSNISKDKIIRELDESILKLKYYRNMILSGKFVIKKNKENIKYQYKFTKIIPYNKVPNFNIKSNNLIINNNNLFK